jgi:hypothetical protein
MPIHGYGAVPEINDAQARRIKKDRKDYEPGSEVVCDYT